jgi:hypothetical protein
MATAPNRGGAQGLKTMMTNMNRPHRRPKLYLPLFLEAATRAGAGAAINPFPMTTDQLRRTVADRVD